MDPRCDGEELANNPETVQFSRCKMMVASMAKVYVVLVGIVSIIGVEYFYHNMIETKIIGSDIGILQVGFLFIFTRLIWDALTVFIMTYMYRKMVPDQQNDM